MNTIYVVRHGETEWNVKGLIQGQMDSPLTENGIKQAEQLSTELKDISFDEVFSSDLLRAKRTAEIITLERNLAIQAIKALREQSYGRYEGTSGEEFRKLFTRWKEMTDQERHTFKLADDVESNEEALIRFITFLREVAIGYREKTILMVTHGAIMRYFLIHLGYGTYDSIKRIHNTAYIKLETDGVDFFIKKVSEVIKAG